MNPYLDFAVLLGVLVLLHAAGWGLDSLLEWWERR